MDILHTKPGIEGLVIVSSDSDFAQLALRFRAAGKLVKPRQSVGGGKFIQNRSGPRSALLNSTAFEGKLTCGDPF